MKQNSALMSNAIDLNGWIGDETRAGITGAFGVSGENVNSRRMVECQGGVEVKSVIDLVLVKRDMLRYVQDAMAVKGMGRGLSNHYVVLCKVRL